MESASVFDGSDSTQIELAQRVHLSAAFPMCANEWRLMLPSSGAAVA